MTLQVTHRDNRGDENTPFGYVYFSDDSRLGYADVEQTKADSGLFATNWEYKHPTTPLHFKLAKEFLRFHKVKGHTE